MTNTYRGDNEIKSIIRVLASVTGKEAYETYGNKLGYAITLAGFEAADIGTFKYIWKFPPENSVFVEINRQNAKSAYNVLKLDWPKAAINVIKMDIGEAIKAYNYISFLNYDTMGLYDEKKHEFFFEAGPRMAEGGIIAYTFYRSRTCEGDIYWDLTKPFGKLTEEELIRIPKNKQKLYSNNKRRFNGYTYLALQALKESSPQYTWAPIMKYKYHTEDGPMGVILFQKRNKIKIGAIFTGNPIDINKQYDDKSMRAIVHMLQEKGHSAKEMEYLLNIPKMTIAGWMAHYTKGKYGTSKLA